MLIRRSEPNSNLPWLVGFTLLVACQAPPAQETPTMSATPPEASTISAADQLLLASARVALPPEGMTLDSLPEPQSAGAQLLQANCTTCHALPSPAMHSGTDWPGVVRRMWLRMDLIDPQYTVPKPELGERIVLLDYLTSNALKVSRATLPDAPGRNAFESTCAQCHELPDPHQHSSQDWFVVVRRMNGHMRSILNRELDNARIEEITRYLTGASM
jgi:cytochrome c5